MRIRWIYNALAVMEALLFSRDKAAFLELVDENAVMVCGVSAAPGRIMRK